MAEFKKVLFHYEHLKLMDLRREELESILNIGDIQTVLKQMQGNAEAITLIHNGRIIACMGYFRILPGVAEVWLIPSVYVKTVPKLFIREVRRYLMALSETEHWHRCQTLTRCDSFHRRWMQSIGFIEEGTLHNYHQGENYIISARLFPEKK